MDSSGTDADDVSGDPMDTIDTAAGDPHFSEDGYHGDSTEYSSSFGPSCSLSDDETRSGVHDMEVDSPFLGRVSAGGAASAPKPVRQKLVTDEWRKTVRPLMWRCQWLELRMKDLSSQVAKYDKEIALIQHEKNLQLEMMKADSSDPELATLDAQSHDRNTMERRKRQRDEDIVDTSLYMNNHEILSYYYEKKNSGADTEGLLIHDDFDNAVDDTKRRVPGNTLPGSKETDRVFEQYSLRDILLTIDRMQSRVLGLQNRLSKVCSNHTQVKVPQKSHKARTQIASCNKDGHRPQKKRDLHTLLENEDTYRPLVGVPSTLSDRSTGYVTGYAKRNFAEEGATQPYAKKVTFETIFGADNPLIHTHVGELYKESADDVLIYNQAAQLEEYQQFERVKKEAENQVKLANKVANTLLFRGEETVTRQLVKHEPVHEIASTVKAVGPGSKRGKKPKKKPVSFLPPLEDQAKKSPEVPAKKKIEKDLHSLKNEKPVFVAVEPRKSKRVPKPKKYGSD
ncbi:uncharacterized protein [Lolium perenne]|uniref:uncharacterized protein n=1 Tax=Lolium perenne TaxID=4522 RepID=UPI0021F64EA8|nr:uncharacterized protein LOC127317261 [Lolium perenne]